MSEYDDGAELTEEEAECMAELLVVFATWRDWLLSEEYSEQIDAWYEQQETQDLADMVADMRGYP